MFGILRSDLRVDVSQNWKKTYVDKRQVGMLTNKQSHQN